MRELFLSQLFSPHDTIKPLFEPRQPFEMNSRFFSTSWIFHFQRTLASLHVFPLEFIFFKLISSSNTFKAILLPRVKHFPLLSLFTQLSAVISIPLWQWFLQRFGKKTAAFCGITVSTLFLFWLANTDGYTLMFVPSCGQSHECSVPVWVTEAHLKNVVLRRVLRLFFLLLFPLHLVDHAVHHDAGLHPQRCGGLRRGCLLWAQRGRFAPAAVVRRWEGRSHFHLYHFSVVRIATYLQKTRRKQTQAMHRTQVEYTLLGPYPNPDIATSLFAGKIIISSPFSITFKISTPPNYLLKMV